MAGGRSALAALFVVLLAAASLAAVTDGRRLYLRQCASCHGVSGRGDGPDAALFVSRPRDLHEGFLARYSTDDLVARVRRGQPLRLALDPEALRRRSANVEVIVGYLQRLPAADWKRADRGWAVYVDRCAMCHGPYGEPLGPPPSGVQPPRSLADPAFQASVSETTMVEVVRHGHEGMPALTPRLSTDETRDVAAYVRLFSPGFAIYTSTCAACHGDHGIPNGSFAEAAPQPTAVFDRDYFTHHDAEALRSSVWHMLDEHQPSMPHYAGVLTEAEARAIVEYLKQQP